MRSILVDWLVDVSGKYKLSPDSLFLAVHLVDLYLEIQSTSRKELQLVGVAALLIAAKFEEVYPPQVKDFVHITDQAFSAAEVMAMEGRILRTLQFKICRP